MEKDTQRVTVSILDVLERKHNNALTNPSYELALRLRFVIEVHML